MKIKDLLTSKKNKGESRHQKKERLNKLEGKLSERMDRMSNIYEVKVKLVRGVLNELR